MLISSVSLCVICGRVVCWMGCLLNLKIVVVGCGLGVVVVGMGGVGIVVGGVGGNVVGVGGVVGVVVVVICRVLVWCLSFGVSKYLFFVIFCRVW